MDNRWPEQMSIYGRWGGGIWGAYWGVFFMRGNKSKFLTQRALPLSNMQACLRLSVPSHLICRPIFDLVGA